MDGPELFVITEFDLIMLVYVTKSDIKGNNESVEKSNETLQISDHDTGGPRFSWTFYLRLCLFTLATMVQNDYFPVTNVRIYRE
jgi:hypothetical protein